MPRLAMFPLGTVLFPHMVLPLHVFEPRYRQMVNDVLEGDGRFGVVLIERGHEVGGGDVRSDIGTVAQVVRAEELDDGRWVVVAVGTQRLRVADWLEDDPYPSAMVELLDDPPAASSDHRDAVADRLRRVLALQTELDEPSAPVTIELANDPLLASYQAAVLAPLSPFDAQRLLAADSAAMRLALLDKELMDLESLLRFRLHGTGGDPAATETEDGNDEPDGRT